MTLHNLLEPEGLVRHFQENPPRDFEVLHLDSGVPAFSTAFDLLTTVEPSIRTWIHRLPAFARWHPLLEPESGFIGTTVSEYALFPFDADAKELADSLTALARRYPLVIVKDLPAEATLVGERALAFSNQLITQCLDAGFVMVEGQALAYVPITFASIEEFLSSRSESRRKNIRRKLKSRTSLQIESIPTGDPRFRDPSLLETMYSLYLNVYQQSDLHFDLLTPAFFQAVLQDASLEGIVFVYRSDGQWIGFNLCFCHEGMLIDKYVGFAYPAAREHNLYTVSWFHNLQYALTRGFTHYVAGWTDPEVKRTLGAQFTFTRHAVHVRNPILRTLMRPFKRFFESDKVWGSSHVIRPDS